MKVGDLLFVYGTLRRGERADLSRHEKEFGVSYVGEDKVNGKIFNLGYYPGAKAESGSFDADNPVISGDVFKLEDASIITMLDHYEGYPHLYNRIETEAASGETVWVYIYNHDVMDEQHIESGDWVNRPRKAA